MADRYGVFRKRDCERIKRVVHTVEGSPRQYVKVPERVPRTAGGGGGSTTSDGLSSPWTVLEYDVTTGDHVRAFDRGKRRSSSVAISDADVLFVDDADGSWIYTVGTGYINRDTGILTKWNADTGEKVWESDAGAFSGPIFAQTGSSNTASRLCIASDGYIWALGTDTSNTCVGRFDPDTGAQTHKGAIATAINFVEAVVELPSDGKVLVICVNSGSSIIFDNTATSIATGTSAIRDYALSSTRIYMTLTSGPDRLKAYDFSFVEQDTRTAPGSEVYGSIETDGTTVWVTTTAGASPMIRAYDATSLATENWNAAQDAGMACRRLMYKNSALYTFPSSTGSVRKHSATDGSETWQSPGTGIRPTAAAVSRNCCAVGSDFVVIATSDTNEQIFCLNDSDGTVRWFDDWSTRFGCYVSDGGRVFLCGGRTGP